MPTEKLIVFVKAPRLGEVKTRLASDVGETEALRIYRQLVERVIENLLSIENVELRFTPDEAFTEIEAWLKGLWTAKPQGLGDLGERMNRAFGDSFEQGMSKVVVIGSDCPTVSRADIDEAFKALDENDLVLGPATDGGYWLIGLTRTQTKLFQNMEWSTADVLPETLKRSGELGLRHVLLVEKTDIDDLKSWKKYQHILADEKFS